jgi:hypothetical protein
VRYRLLDRFCRITDTALWLLRHAFWIAVFVAALAALGLHYHPHYDLMSNGPP